MPFNLMDEPAAGFYSKPGFLFIVIPVIVLAILLTIFFLRRNKIKKKP